MAQISYEQDTSDAALLSILSNLGAKTRESIDTIVQKGTHHVAAALAIKEKFSLELREPLVTVNGIEITSQESFMIIVDAEVERVLQAVLKNQSAISSQQLVDYGVQKVSRRNPAVADMSLERVNVAKFFLNPEIREAIDQVK